MAKTTIDVNGVKITIEGDAKVTVGNSTVTVGSGSSPVAGIPHKGPFQEWTEVCLACGRNSYAYLYCNSDEKAPGYA